MLNLLSSTVLTEILLSHHIFRLSFQLKRLALELGTPLNIRDWKGESLSSNVRDFIDKRKL
jgi:hypothetical protein